MSGSEDTKPLSDATQKLKKTGYTNPAFKAMGIPTLRLPSRNWMIFWTVLTVSVSGIVYDKQQQKKITKKWCTLVEPLSKEKLAVNERPRKITVFVAPPPSDYLDTSMTIWKRYVKPVLFSSGVDYEIFTEESQGLIRVEVAERIRELRRELIKHDAELKWLEAEGKIWNKFKKAITQGVSRLRSAEELDSEKEKILALKYKTDFDYKNLLGVYRENKNRNLKIVSQDSLVTDPSMSGGVICIGRGAYKEYIDGLHEGFLGPLDPPQTQKSGATENQETEAQTINPPAKEQSSEQENSAEHVEEPGATEEQAATETSEEAPEKPKPLPKPYITAAEYASAKIPSELASSDIIREVESQIPALFHQPILVLPMPHLVGFLNIPERIYRFYRKRYVADAFCRATASCVLQKVRPFEPTMDLDLAKLEENDWPKKWVQQGKERNSEWVRELQGDERVLTKLRVFEPSMIDDEEN
ncbi:LANO_0F06348g1_1 [Lachancea nothofagi CBS 11611]|uniref:Mitochondrial import inner membrane translocase subunit TIM54 n=1 Tax=Lachancea nothofagi CBS 11611 TaxID=1266666 RepID=A0A1G4K8G1_9SACH|nr:LANO_0F06348g1_1 [Lachancea nothofagi CBS 11611]